METSQNAERLQTRWGPFSAKLKATTKEFHEEKIQ